MRWEYKLADGTIREWDGADPGDGARRLVDCIGGTVVAWRAVTAQGTVVALGESRIVP